MTDTDTATLAGIAIAPELMAPMQARGEAEVDIAAGILGDARGRKRGRQITLLFADDWGAALADAGGAALHLGWMARRANILISGMRTPQNTGGEFIIGAVRLEVMEETAPCHVMENTAPGLRAALAPHWRGGVCCRVLAGGRIAVGDAVRYISHAGRVRHRRDSARGDSS